MTEKVKKDPNIWKVPAQVYSRVCGYFRPVDNWNLGKRSEFEERKTATVTKETVEPF